MRRRSDGLAIATMGFLALLTIVGSASMDDRALPSTEPNAPRDSTTAHSEPAALSPGLALSNSGVPEEAAMVLVGTVLLGLAAAVRRTA